MANGVGDGVLGHILKLQTYPGLFLNLVGRGIE
jgi:hypothetical protein